MVTRKSQSKPEGRKSKRCICKKRVNLLSPSSSRQNFPVSSHFPNTPLCNLLYCLIRLTPSGMWRNIYIFPNGLADAKEFRTFDPDFFCSFSLLWLLWVSNVCSESKTRHLAHFLSKMLDKLTPFSYASSSLSRNFHNCESFNPIFRNWDIYLLCLKSGQIDSFPIPNFILNHTFIWHFWKFIWQSAVDGIQRFKILLYVYA